MRIRMKNYESWTREALIARIKQLEGGNEPGKGSTGASAPATAAITAPQAKKPKKKKEMDFSKYSTRHIAIRFAYLGWNYHGLAYHTETAEHTHPTVEGQILRALHKTRCISSMDPTQIGFSRCGRTDAKVSAMAQVIALNVRSQLPPEEHNNADADSKELQYLKILNSHLPNDILAYEVCLRPPAGFDARFSCVARHYRYYFSSRGLDVEAMRDAAKRFLGVDRDFRNFCKIDASKQITNFCRTILAADIVPAGATGEIAGDMMYLSLKGTAFLWNQVRSMMAILFLVGQHRESPDIIDILLDAGNMPQRPVYEIASAIPLVLYNCEYEEGSLAWQTSEYTSRDSVFDLWHDHLQKLQLTTALLEVAAPPRSQPLSTDYVNVGSGIGRRCARYQPLLERPRTDPPEVINARYSSKS